jgi:beta-ketoacyl synthase-like protein
MRGARVEAVGVVTGWGEGVRALPDDAGRAAAGRLVVPLATPARADDRFRRATRECLLGVAAVEALLRKAGASRDVIAGDRTALHYATAAAYGSSNRRFIEDRGAGALGFPYTAPSAVPAEVAIEYRLTGSYVILLGGPTATIDALWQASRSIARGAADRALVLAVETFEDCADLFRRSRWLVRGPLVEAAACALLVPDERRVDRSADGGRDLEDLARRRAGETLACGPLIALALACERGGPATVTGEWRGRRATLEVPPTLSGRGSTRWGVSGRSGARSPRR